MRKHLSFIQCAFLSIFITVVLSSTTAAFAHAGVISSNPSEGEVLTALPNEILFTFSEALLVVADKEINTLKLTRYDGLDVLLEDLTVTGNVLTASVTAGDYRSGLYEIAYRVISADGHEVSASITFSLNTPITPAESSEAIEVSKSGAIPLPIALTLALLIAIGGFFLFERRRSSK